MLRLRAAPGKIETPQIYECRRLSGEQKRNGTYGLILLLVNLVKRAARWEKKQKWRILICFRIETREAGAGRHT